MNASNSCSHPSANPCSTPPAGRSSSQSGAMRWFEEMIPRCLEYAREAHEGGRPIVGILCEFTPRELIMAAGGVPVCLCGGSAATIPPAEQHLPANLCPLIKSTYGYHLQGSNPFLEMADLVVAETTCDGKKKMYELMGEHRPMCVLSLPHQPDTGGALASWRSELERLRTLLEQRFSTPITEEGLRAAIRLMNRERDLRRRLAALMKAPWPPITGRQLLSLKSSISCIPAALDAFEALLAELSQVPPEPGQRSPVRVLLTGVPTVHGAERTVEIIESSGGLLVCMESCTGLKPVLEDVSEDHPDPMHALAEKYLHLPCSIMTPNDRRPALLRQLVSEYRPDCVIELVWQGCLTYDVESHRTRRLVSEELRLPYLKIETDYSRSDSSRIALRVEALFETVRHRRGPAAADSSP